MSLISSLVFMILIISYDSTIIPHVILSLVTLIL